VRALREGRVDVLRYVPEGRADEVDALPGVRLLARPGLLTYYLMFDSRPGKGGPPNPFADRRVRQALSLAIDREAILRKLRGRGLPAEQLVQPGVFGHLTGLPPLAHDPQRARRLLAEAGYPDGFEVTLLHRALPTVEQVVASVRDMLGAIGVKVRLAAPDWKEVVEGWQQARLGFFYAGWRFETGDAWGFLRDVIQTRDPERGSGTMNPGFSDPRLDRLIEENGLILGEANRLRQYSELMQVALQEMPIVPVYHRLNLYGVADRVRWEPRLDGRMLAAEMRWADAP
jgi:peptide/nickel transport system substrate-binding protein